MAEARGATTRSRSSLVGVEDIGQHPFQTNHGRIEEIDLIPEQLESYDHDDAAQPTAERAASHADRFGVGCAHHGERGPTMSTEHLLRACDVPVGNQRDVVVVAAMEVGGNKHRVFSSTLRAVTHVDFHH